LALFSNTLTDFYPRPASIEDSKILFMWVNLPENILIKKDVSEPISWEEHSEWMNVRLRDKDTLIWILEKESKAIGQMRVEKKDEEFHIDVYVVPEYRRTGIARKALSFLINESGKKWPGEKLFASIRMNNLASKKTFISVGFEYINTDNEFDNFQYVL
jgi:ribosomal protein S18 acetylase RimI-like enzyme